MILIESVIGPQGAFTCLQFCFEGRNRAAFVGIEIFPNIYLWGFETFFVFSFFIKVFFRFCRLLLLLCFGLHFAVLFVALEFCDFAVSVKSHRSLLLCSSFLL